MIRAPATQSDVKELKTTKQQISRQTFPNAWNWITGESQPTDKALGEKERTRLVRTSAEMQQSIQGTALSHISSCLIKKPTAFSTAKPNTPEETVALIHIRFSLTREAHSCKSFCWLQHMHSALQCAVALLFICSLIHIPTAVVMQLVREPFFYITQWTFSFLEFKTKLLIQAQRATSAHLQHKNNTLLTSAQM